MITSELAQQLAEEDAKRPPPVIPENGRASVPSEPQTPQGPSYAIWRPWYKRLLAKGCARCGGEPPGWVQRQIETPYRFKRALLWLVNLIPRGASLVHVLLSRRVSAEQQAERDAQCQDCPGITAGCNGSHTPGRRVQLRVIRGVVKETSFCNLCDCPMWRIPRRLRWIWDLGSHLPYKNKKKGWLCPLRIHAGSNHELRLVEHVRAKQAAAPALGADNPNGAAMTN
jgi:hypothetical protein